MINFDKQRSSRYQFEEIHVVVEDVNYSASPTNGRNNAPISAGFLCCENQTATSTRLLSRSSKKLGIVVEIIIFVLSNAVVIVR